LRLLCLSLLIVLSSMAIAQPDSLRVFWDRSGAGDHSRYGIPQPLGDQNNDGLADFAVWALGWGSPGQPSEPLAELFHGGNPPYTVPYMIFRSDTITGHDFWRFQSVGDLNGDGFVDWQVWMYREQDSLPFTINTYWGGPNADTIPDLVFHMPVQSWVYPAGDFNGDGFDDLYLAYIIGDSGVILYGGNPMDTLADWRLHSPPGHREQALAQSFGDLNGDGFSDFVSTTPPPERITYIFLGSAAPDTNPRFTWDGFWGGSGNIVPDLNGDGFADLLFHATNPHWTIHLGGQSPSPTPSFVMNFIAECSWSFASGLGDVNNDGYNDVALIDPGCNNLWGTMCIYLGHPWLNPDPAMTIQGRDLQLNLIGINNTAGLGDVNGDRINDFAIGAFNTNFDGFRGRCVILSGDTSLRADVPEPKPKLPDQLAVSIFPNPFNSTTTISLNVPLGARHITLTTFNLLGQVVREDHLPAAVGQMVFHYDASALASGIYLLRVEAGRFLSTQKIMVLR
jgi:hypothetical protein